MKLPSSPEIKRVLAAAKSAGIEIGAVKISNDSITIFAPGQAELPALSAYEKWKATRE